MPDIFISKEDSQTPTKTEKPSPGKIVQDVETEKQRQAFPEHSHNPLAAYSLYPDPDKINFETKEEDEKVILFLRQHPIVNVKWIVIAILMVFAPALLGSFPILSFLPGNFQFIAILIWYLVTLAFAIENFLNWFFNIYIVTNERVVDIDFNNLIYKEVSDADIDKVQDVTYKMGGVIRTLFNYGDIQVQTAAEVSQFEFLAVPNPDKVAKIIQELQMQEEVEKYGHK